MAGCAGALTALDPFHSLDPARTLARTLFPAARSGAAVSVDAGGSCRRAGRADLRRLGFPPRCPCESCRRNPAKGRYCSTLA
ncbi:hypothetical protein PSP6_740008 [Paraburkholderia tropica]|nr:hypothetical protein PSP6_740008 [Paraburkholderia tropica]